MAGNPRIDDLRKRLDRDPGSRLFAQLAEELRKDGELEEAIRVCRQGLQKHPAYPSARMTLGRALLDTGDLDAARTEFETVLKGAPDNILASRFLGECLEGLGDLAGARERYKATLALAPGDKQVTAHLRDLEARLKTGPAVPAATVSAPAAPPPAPGPLRPATAPPRPARMGEPMGLERPHEAPTIAIPPEPAPSPESTVVMGPMTFPVAPAAPPPKPEAEPEPPPIPLVAAEEDFELERAYEAPVNPAAPAAAAEPSVTPSEFDFDLGPDSGAPSVVPEPWRPQPASPAPMPPPESPPPASPVIAAPVPPAPMPPVPIPSVPVPPAPMATPVPPEPAPPLPVEVSPPAPATEPEAGDLTSSTLAELYFNQGFTDKAIEVYRQLLQREPDNERARTRLDELEALERRLKDEETRGAAEGGGPGDPAAARRQAIERTIARLEGLLTALRKE